MRSGTDCRCTPMASASNARSPGLPCPVERCWCGPAIGHVAARVRGVNPADVLSYSWSAEYSVSPKGVGRLRRGEDKGRESGVKLPGSTFARRRAARYEVRFVSELWSRGTAHAHAPTARSLQPRGRRSSGVGRRGRRADAVRALLRQEQRPLRHVRVEHLRHRSFRHLLLPGRAKTHRTRRQLRRERVPAGQRGPEARPVVPRAADSLQDAQRVRAGERRSGGISRGRRRVRRAVARPDGAADRRALRPAVRPHPSRAHARLPVRHHPAVAHPPELSAVGRRRRGRVGARQLGSRSI